MQRRIQCMQRRAAAAACATRGALPADVCSGHAVMAGAAISSNGVLHKPWQHTNGPHCPDCFAFRPVGPSYQPDPPPTTNAFWTLPNPWPLRFEDRDFLGELRKPEGERKIKCEPLLREDAVQVWKQYAQRPDNVHY